MKSIAVVILNWNGKELLEKFLPSITAHSKDAAIYVADNASTDDSLQFLKSAYPAVKTIENKNNSGYAKGYNDALQYVNEEIYVLLNSDVEVTEGWLQPVIDLFESDSETAIIQPKILDYKNKAYFEYAGAAGGFIDKYGYPFCRGRIFDTVEIDSGQYDDNTEIFWASGACLFIRKDSFWDLGGFDEDFFAHQEEIDLCWRAFNKNYKVRFCYESVVYHVGGATLRSGNPRKTYLNYRNSLLMMIKNLPDGKLARVFFIRLLMDGLASIQFLSQGKFKHIIAIIKAHYFVFFNFRKFLNKRAPKQYTNYFKAKSIVYSYFVRSVKIFKNNFNNSL